MGNLKHNVTFLCCHFKTIKGAFLLKPMLAKKMLAKKLKHVYSYPNKELAYQLVCLATHAPRLND